MIALLALARIASSEASLEDSLFAAEASPRAVQTDSVIAPAAPSAPSAGETAPSSPGISGQVQTSWTSRFLRDDLPGELRKYVDAYPGQEFETAGRLDLDAPLPDRSRAHLTLELDHLASTGKAAFAMREAFVDAVLFGTLSVRAGKQVLQWSRCQLWTPADLVNVEAPRFQARLGAREGVAGVRAHLPVGAQFNIYGFADLGGATRPSDVAAVGRVEFTLPHTEVGATWRHKDGERDVPAIDLSTGFARWQVAMEAAWLAPGTLLRVEPTRVVDGQGLPVDAIVPVDRRALQVSVSVSRPFDALGRTDRLRLGVEGFWNPEGESDNVFDDIGTRVRFDRPVFVGRDTALSGPAAALRIFGGAYRPYQLNRAYAMGFATLSDVFVKSGTLQLSALGNLDDGSWQGLAQWGWQSLHGLEATVSATIPFGAYPGEFTWTSDYATLRADLGIRF